MSLSPAERTIKSRGGCQRTDQILQGDGRRAGPPTLLRLQLSYMATRGRTRQQTTTQALVLAPGWNLVLTASICLYLLGDYT